MKEKEDYRLYFVILRRLQEVRRLPGVGRKLFVGSMWIGPLPLGPSLAQLSVVAATKQVPLRQSNEPET